MTTKKTDSLIVRPDDSIPIIEKIIGHIDLEVIDKIVKDGMDKGKPTARMVRELTAYFSNFVGKIIDSDPTLIKYDIETAMKLETILMLNVVQKIQFGHIVAHGDRDLISMTELAKYGKVIKQISESIPRVDDSLLPEGSSKEVVDVEATPIEEIPVDVKKKSDDDNPTEDEGDAEKDS